MFYNENVFYDVRVQTGDHQDSSDTSSTSSTSDTSPTSSHIHGERNIREAEETLTGKVIVEMPASILINIGL